MASGKEIRRLIEEIELLKRKIRRWEIIENKLSTPFLKGRVNIFGGKSEDEIDWSKAGKT